MLFLTAAVAVVAVAVGGYVVKRNALVDNSIKSPPLRVVITGGTKGTAQLLSSPDSSSTSSPEQIYKYIMIIY